MKKLLLFMLFFVFFTILSCKKSEEPRLGLEMPYQVEFTIPAGIGAFDVHHFQIKNIPTRYDQLLAQANKSDADIVAIKTLEAALGGIFGDADLSFISQASVRVYQETDPNDYIEVAYRDVTPLDPGNQLPLFPSLANFKRLMNGPRFSVDVTLWLRRTTETDTDVRLNMKLNAEY
jgi:hypothetical protein